jgi:pyruvate dehydrogenase E2 component (dihydrolipoyllysine-residue acetyltransferase)
MVEIVMPRLSDSMEEGTIVRWLVADGGEVVEGGDLVEIETDKATMTYESDYSGTLCIDAAAGDTLAVGAVIALVLAANEAHSVPASNDRGASAIGPSTRPSSPPDAHQAVLTAADAVKRHCRIATRPKASPAARRTASALNVDLGPLEGSGPRQRILKRDVEKAADRSRGTGEKVDGGRRTAFAGAVRGEVHVEELSRGQSTIARRMAHAKATMPEFTLTTDVDIDGAVELRTRLKELSAHAVPSYNDFVVRACALALRAHPRANGAFRDGRFESY